MHTPSLILLAAFLGATSITSAAQQPENLFNGKDLTGWIQRGGKAMYAVEGNEIVGTSVLHTDNSFLCAEKTYGNLRITELGSAAEIPANLLTSAEKAAGWRLLWDGKTSAGWRSAKSEVFPAEGWQIEDGALAIHGIKGSESAGAGDIITHKRYSQFELLVDFKITPGANSGIKYFVQPNLDPITGTGAKAATGSAIGLEFQILDDERHPDAKRGHDGDRTIASLYDLIPAAASKKPNAIGDWNTARIVVRGQHVEHWLNGTKVLEYERGSQAFRDLVALSKYKHVPGFGEWLDGHILLQDHGFEASFRNIKIRVPAGK